MFLYIFVAGEEFLIKPNISGEAELILSYVLSRAGKVVEKTFGILTSRFRNFRRPICTCCKCCTNNENMRTFACFFSEKDE